jgi:pyruvate, orthophosphate dikinase
MTVLRLGQCPDAKRELIGGKAFSINSMLTLGLPVPPAFVLGTDECARYYASDRKLADDVLAELRTGIEYLESTLGRKFGSAQKPLLVSVRSGAPRSMPGMMDTVLNLGINDSVEAALREETADAGYAADTHRRFKEQFHKVVGSSPSPEPWEQLQAAVAAVFDSWHSPRAVAYRRHHGISEEGGTAVTVQAMVFGNLDDHSGTGVLFTRDPVTAQSEPFGEWLPKGQGEDVVSGRCTPLTLGHLAEFMPDVHKQLMDSAALLERTFCDVQDIEFTVESGHLWLLQTRSAKRSATAAVHHAVTFEKEGIVTPEGALAMISPEQLSAFLRPHLVPTARIGAKVLARGEVACPGVVTGVVVGTADEAEEMAEQGIDVILARPTTDPDDVHGILAARAIITEIGGATSHAAVVSREFNRACVVGCGEGSLMGLVGRNVTVDATSGEIMDGILEVEIPSKDTHPDLRVVTGWLAASATGSDNPLNKILAAAH